MTWTHHTAARHGERVTRILAALEPGGYYRSPQHYRRLHADRPAPTLTAACCSQLVHPTEPRCITPREAACLQDFPSWFRFVCRRSAAARLIGNAVPVRLGAAVGRSVVDYLDAMGCEHAEIVSLFTGAGGLDLGLGRAASDQPPRLRTVFAIDMSPQAAATVCHNWPKWGCVWMDIRRLDPALVRERLSGVPLVVVGGPPRQLWGDFVRIVAALSPELALAEHAPSLVRHPGWSDIVASLAELGYTVRHRVLQAADYGTPQLRRRLFFVAARQPALWRWPEPTHAGRHRTVGEAFASLPPPAQESHDPRTTA